MPLKEKLFGNRLFKENMEREKGLEFMHCERWV